MSHNNTIKLKATYGVDVVITMNHSIPFRRKHISGSLKQPTSIVLKSHPNNMQDYWALAPVDASSLIAAAKIDFLHKVNTEIADCRQYHGCATAIFTHTPIVLLDADITKETF